MDIGGMKQYLKNEIVIPYRAEIKKKMLDASISKHQTVIDDLKQGIKEMLARAVVVNEDELDLSQQGFNSEIIHKVDNLAKQIKFANEEMELLYSMLTTIKYIHDCVMPGSVVVMDNGVFFVSVSIEEFEVEDRKVLGLSTESPLYQEMEYKERGDTFYFNERQFKIQEVF